MTDNRFRAIPPVQGLLETPAAARLIREYSRQETVAAIRARLDSIRETVRQNGAAALPDFYSDRFFAGIRDDILAGRKRSLQPVINATGIILHTNLGRAPLAGQALQMIQETAAGYCNLEFNLQTGKRGSRYMHIGKLLQQLTGAEAALVVNNCAAAVLVTLNTLAKDREVIVSRGELIEIGGGFRMPDVIAATGAILRETGTTNKTRLADYAAAINEQTAVILSNHTSNYEITGFTEAPATAELCELAHERGLYMVKDLGSGALLDPQSLGIGKERSVRQLLDAGTDVVLFSGDKLLGGPQAGIIAGRSEPIAAIRKNPLLRALRIDKLSLAALEATLDLYRVPENARRHIPVLRMLGEDKSSIRKKARKLLRSIRSPGSEQIEAWLEDGTSYIGGGSAPMHALPTCLIRLRFSRCSAEEAAVKLRAHTPPLIGRIADDTFILDLRTVLPDQISLIRSALQSLA